MHRIRVVTVVLALEDQNPHKERLAQLRSRFFGSYDETRIKQISQEQRRVYNIWRKFGDGALTEVA